MVSKERVRAWYESLVRMIAQPEIEITSAMISAGVEVLDAEDQPLFQETLVQEVYRAMERAKEGQK